MGAPETGIMTDIRPFGGGFSGLCDTSEYSWNAPYVTVWVAMAPQDAGWHNWGVNYCAAGSIGKKALDKGADLIALTGADILQDPALLARAAAEWKERLGGETYKCLLPKELEPPIHLNEDTMAKYRKGA
jgi:aminobenzoyl-glutamate utilization protein B